MPHLKQFPARAKTAVLTRSSVASLGRNVVLVNGAAVAWIGFDANALPVLVGRVEVFAGASNGFNSLF